MKLTPKIFVCSVVAVFISMLPLVTQADEKVILKEHYYESLEVHGDELYAVNLTNNRVERYNLVTGEHLLFSGGASKGATDYSVYKKKVYVYSREGMVDVFDNTGTLERTFPTPLKYHDFFLVVGENEYITLCAWRMDSIGKSPEGQDICYFNEEKVLWVKDLPLNDELNNLSATILLKPTFDNGAVSIRFPNAPYILQMSKDLKKHRLLEWSYPNLEKAFELQKKTKPVSNGLKMHRALRWQKELDDRYVVAIDEFGDNYAICLLLGKNNMKVMWEKEIGEPWNRQPLEVWKNGDALVCLYTLRSERGINLFTLDKKILNMGLEK